MSDPNPSVLAEAPTSPWNDRLPPGAPEAADDDEALCIALLPAVSRTFALSIEMLPTALREPVRLGYLICRIADTIEDDPDLALTDREHLFDALDDALADRALAARVEDLARRTGAGEDEEAVLIQHTGAVMRRFFALDEATRADMVGPIREMIRGMRLYSRRTHAEGRLRLEDVEDLEHYCYFVAGTVGELLTALFLRHGPTVAGPVREALDARAVPFGLALQIVNITKDVAEDLTRGVSFVPERTAAAHGTSPDQLLDEDLRDANLAVIAELCEVARKHLVQAIAYTRLWPADGDTGSGIRLFCLVPLMLAIETLGVILTGEDTLKEGRTPKVTRAVVHRVVAASLEASRDDAAFDDLVSSYGLEDALSL